MPNSSFSTPKSVDSNLGTAKIANVRKVAKWQRLLMASLMVYLALGVLVRLGFAPAEYVDFARLGVSFFHLWCIISICQFLSMERESWIYFIGVFIPYINLVVRF